MRLSCFNLYVDDYPEKGDVLVHNTFSGAYLVLDQDTVAALRKLDSGAELTPAELELTSDPDYVDPDVAILVESRKAEEAEFRTWFEKRKNTGVVDVIVGINLACNFDCPYCCQAEVMSGKTMSWEDCDRTADFLVERAVTAGVGKIHVSFVGGEPLLHPDRIKHIATRVREAIADKDIEFEFALITNAYFLDDDMVSDLLPYGLAAAQITLDGDASTHSITRVSKKGEDTFQRIFDNTIAASKRIRVSVNGNYQSNTIHGFGPLIEQLAAAGLAETSRMRFSPALEGLSSVEGAGSGCSTLSQSESQYMTALHDAIVGAGFATSEINAMGPCMFHDRHSYAIDPDGTILKCPGFMGHPEWGIGTLETGLTRRHKQILHNNPQRECGGCAHRPNCGGGCIAAHWMEQGRIEGVNCEFEYFESVTADGVARSFELARSDSMVEAAESFPQPTVMLPELPAFESGRAVRTPNLRVVA